MLQVLRIDDNMNTRDVPYGFVNQKWFGFPFPECELEPE